MLELHNYGWFLLPFGTYFLVKKSWLDRAQLYILIIANLLILSIIFDGIIMQISYIILVGFQEGFVLSLAKQHIQTPKDLKNQQQTSFILKLININFQEIIFLVFVASLWVGLRMYTHLTPQLPEQLMNQYISFNYFLLNVLQGWNCTFIEYTIFNGLWLLYLLLGWGAIVYLRKYSINPYKELLLTYKIIPDIIFVGMAFFYNLISYQNANNVWKCKEYWQNGKLIHIFIYFGIPITTLVFFYKKNNQEFQIEKQDDIQLKQNFISSSPINQQFYKP